MKLASALLGLSSFAAADATETWLVNTWWEKAVEVFNFKENNWGDFSAAVATVDQRYCILVPIFYKNFLAILSPLGTSATRTAMTKSASRSSLLAASASPSSWALPVPASTTARRSSPSTGTSSTPTTATLFPSKSGVTLRPLLVPSTLSSSSKPSTLMKMA